MEVVFYISIVSGAAVLMVLLLDQVLDRDGIGIMMLIYLSSVLRFLSPTGAAIASLRSVTHS